MCIWEHASDIAIGKLSVGLVRDCNPWPGQQLRPRREVFAPEDSVKGPGESSTLAKRGHHVRRSQRADIRGINFFEMVGARSIELYRKARGARPGKLLGVQSRHQTKRASGRQNAPRLRYGECAAVAVNITELG